MLTLTSLIVNEPPRTRFRARQGRLIHIHLKLLTTHHTSTTMRARTVLSRTPVSSELTTTPLKLANTLHHRTMRTMIHARTLLRTEPQNLDPRLPLQHLPTTNLTLSVVRARTEPVSPRLRSEPFTTELTLTHRQINHETHPKINQQKLPKYIRTHPKVKGYSTTDTSPTTPRRKRQHNQCASPPSKK
jgi:hypothetical protein